MKQAPGLHRVLIFEPEVFSPEVSMAENSKPDVGGDGAGVAGCDERQDESVDVEQGAD